MFGGNVEVGMSGRTKVEKSHFAHFTLGTSHVMAAAAMKKGSDSMGVNELY